MPYGMPIGPLTIPLTIPHHPCPQSDLSNDDILRQRALKLKQRTDKIGADTLLDASVEISLSASRVVKAAAATAAATAATTAATTANLRLSLIHI